MHSEHSNTNGQERLASSESHTENRGGVYRGQSSKLKIEEEALQKNQADETGRGGHRRANWRTGHAADRANIKKQTVWSDWRGKISTCKIEEEGSGGWRMKPAGAGTE